MEMELQIVGDSFFPVRSRSRCRCAAASHSLWSVVQSARRYRPSSLRLERSVCLAAEISKATGRRRCRSAKASGRGWLPAKAAFFSASPEVARNYAGAQAANHVAGLRLPIGTNLPSLTLMIVTSLSGARDLFEKSAFPVTPAKLVIVKMASLIAFELRSVDLFIASTIKLTESYPRPANAFSGWTPYSAW